VVESCHRLLSRNGVLVVTVPLASLNPATDHKTVFYVKELLETLAPLFEVREMAVQAAWVCAVARRSDSASATADLARWSQVADGCLRAVDKGHVQREDALRRQLERAQKSVDEASKRDDELAAGLQRVLEELAVQTQARGEAEAELKDTISRLERTSGELAVQTQARGQLEKERRAWLEFDRQMRRACSERERIARYLAKEAARLENHISFRVGRLVAEALKRPYLLIPLPLRVGKLLLPWFLRRSGIRSSTVSPIAEKPAVAFRPLPETPKTGPVPGATEPRQRPASVAVSIERRPHIPSAMAAQASAGAAGLLFFCVNGAGLGHVTRSLAVARRVRRLQPEVPVIFLTTSKCPELIAREGVTVYHIESRDAQPGMSASEWHQQLREKILEVCSSHPTKALVYDGVSLYRGLLLALLEINTTYAAMMLRLRHKHGRLAQSLEGLKSFDEIILPGEAGIQVDSKELLPPELHSLNVRAFPPIVYPDREELLPRDSVRAKWNVPEGQKVVYVQLGAGNINDIVSWEDHILSLLMRRDDVFPVLAESPITSETRDRKGVYTLRDYPNSRYFAGVDLAITAAGYNTFHELLYLGVPSVFIPNQETRTDDQVARSLVADKEQAGIMALTPESVEEAISRGLRPEVAAAMRERARKLVPDNGAEEVAQMLLCRMGIRVPTQAGA
jgi:UDP:flavonoid glycosyltransferase YjiC (YdhE family)